jgi:plastocyanin
MVSAIRPTVAIAVLILAACGGGAAPATTAPGAAPAGGASAGEVTVQGFAFKPQTVEVKTGAKVTWTNQDGAPHTTTSGTPGAKDGKWEGQLAGSGGSFSFTFAQAGSFPYFCAIHGASMTGTVVVK